MSYDYLVYETLDRVARLEPSLKAQCAECWPTNGAIADRQTGRSQSSDPCPHHPWCRACLLRRLRHHTDGRPRCHAVYAHHPQQ
ncbi:hypothetical protein NKDENANG_02765 [Candidatus Entotheonellaceae bacterium PAL068K]